MTNHYQVLGLTNAATPAEIRRAFRILARRYHPDVNPGEQSGEKFKRIARAHAVLSDPEKRRAHDVELERAAESFSQTFDRAHEIFRRNQSSAAYKKAAASKPQTTSDKESSPPPATEAPRPSPTRKTRAPSQELKQLASASRQVIRTLRDSFLPRYSRRKSRRETSVSHVSLVELSVSMVEAIQGTRRSVEIEGDSSPRRKISVRVPPGVRTGSIVRLRRKEDPSEEVVVIVHVEHHPWLSISPRGLTMEIPLTIGEAINGGKIQVPSLGDPLLVTVEPNTQCGREVRLRNQGIHLRDGTRGDLFIRFLIKLPSNLNTSNENPSGRDFEELYAPAIREHLPKSILEGARI